jgi:hypothetical protein
MRSHQKRTLLSIVASTAEAVSDAKLGTALDIRRAMSELNMAEMPPNQRIEARRRSDRVLLVMIRLL